MGRWTSSAVVKFKLRDNNWNNPVLNNTLVKLREEGYDRGDGLGISWDDDGMIIPVVKNGWKYYYDCGTKYKDHNGNELICDTLEKDDIELLVYHFYKSTKCVQVTQKTHKPLVF